MFKCLFVSLFFFSDPSYAFAGSPSLLLKTFCFTLPASLTCLPCPCSVLPKVCPPFLLPPFILIPVTVLPFLPLGFGFFLLPCHLSPTLVPFYFVFFIRGENCFSQLCLVFLNASQSVRSLFLPSATALFPGAF